MSVLPSVERLIKDAHRVLENPFWIDEIEPDFSYERLHDDHDGTFEGKICVNFLSNGDAVISVVDIRHRPSSYLRFRTPGGGGKSPRTRNALMLLALAIKLDNEEKRT